MSPDSKHVVYYAIDDTQLACLERIKRRLHTEDRLTGDEMRDLGHAIEAIISVVRQIQVAS